MKNAIILHGTGASPDNNWFPWLKKLLEGNDYERIYIPLLPHPEQPSLEDNVNFVMDSDYEFNSNSLVIGHSYGAYTALGVLEKLPKDVTVDTVVLVGLFKGYDLDLELIKQKAKRIVLLHSDDDPRCDVKTAIEVADKLNAEKIIVHGEDHFSTYINPKHISNPYLVDILELKDSV